MELEDLVVSHTRLAERLLHGAQDQEPIPVLAGQLDVDFGVPAVGSMNRTIALKVELRSNP